MEFRFKAFKPPHSASVLRRKYCTYIFLATVCVTSWCVSMSAQCEADDEKPAPVVARVQVQASPEVVFEAIHRLRGDEPTGVRILSHNPHEATIEEIFDGLPIVGQATCVYKEQYSPPNRIDFHMIESDKLKAFDGWWKITRISPGVSEVELATGVDTGLRIPFARQITNAATLHNLHEQLADMKKSAETLQQASLKTSM